MQRLRQTSSVKKPWWFWVLLLAALFASITWAWGATHQKKPAKPPATSYSQVDRRLNDGKVKKLTWNPNNLTIQVTETNKKIEPYVVGVPASNGQEGLQRLLADARAKNVPVESKPIAPAASNGPLEIIIRLLPLMLIIGVSLYLMRSMGPFKKMDIAPAMSKISFQDVAGAGEAVDELQDVRAFLADTTKYQKLGARVPKGVLLYGPPGTGKTLLAKAVANEAGVPFYQTSGAEFVEMYAGLGAKRVRQLFDEAKKTAPCIIFIDELDAVGGRRSGGGGDGAVREADQTLNQILTEMDGFEVSEHPVVLMGATNRLDTLDPALLRPGRFDRHIAIDPPDKHGRHEILKIHARGKPLSEDVDLWTMAVQSAGFSGADLSLWLNEGALLAARRDGTEITSVDLENAYFRIIAGAEKQHSAMSPRERKVVAYHEAGHAIVGERLSSTDRIHKISIIPRGDSGGQTITVSEEDVYLHSEQQLKDDLAMLLAGRAAEEIVFGSITSGASNDLQRASALCMKMATQLGMGNILGLRVVTRDSALSPSHQSQVDDEIKRMLGEAKDRATEIIIEDRELLNQIAEKLLVEETIDREGFLAIMGLPDDISTNPDHLPSVAEIEAGAEEVHQDGKDASSDATSAHESPDKTAPETPSSVPAGETDTPDRADV